MKAKRKKIIGHCDNPFFPKYKDDLEMFESLPIFLKRDYSRNGTRFILGQNNFNTYSGWPNMCDEAGDFKFVNKI